MRASSGPPVKQWKIVRSGTPSSSSTRNVSSHASREWMTSGLPACFASRIWKRNARLLLVARRMLVVEVEAALADRDARRRTPRAARACPTRRRASTRRADAARPRAYTSGWRSASVTAACDVSRSVPTHTIHSTPAARARVDVLVAARELQVAVGVDPAQLRPDPASRVLAREQRLALLERSRPRAAGPTPPRRAGARPRAGPARPSRRHSSAAAFGITGDASSATIRSDLETVAEHRRDRVGVARFVELPRLRVLDVRVRRADQTPRPRRSRSRSRDGVIASDDPANAVAGDLAQRTVGARRRARHRRSSSPPCSARGSRGCRSCWRGRRCSAAPSPRTRSRRRDRTAGRP